MSDRRRLPIGVLGLLAPMLAVGCGMGQATTASPPAEAPREVRQQEALRAEQAWHLAELERIDASAGDGSRCDELCTHYGHICRLATRICALADQVPESHRAADSCERAAATCMEARRRLPSRCACEGGDGAAGDAVPVGTAGVPLLP